MKLAYLDSSVWIARTEGLTVYREIIQDRLEKLSTEGWLFCISEAVLLEVLPKPYTDQNYRVLTIYNKLFEQTRVLKNFPRVFENALLIAQSEHLKAMDAIQLATNTHTDSRGKLRAQVPQVGRRESSGLVVNGQFYRVQNLFYTRNDQLFTHF